MLKLFNPPATDFVDHYDQARFRLAWQVIIFLMIALFLTSLIFFFVDIIFFFQYIAGFVIVSFALYSLYKTRRYQSVSRFVVLSTFPLVGLSLFLIPNVPHVVEPLWLIAIAIFAYFSLGIKWGNSVVFAIIVLIGSYLIFQMPYNKVPEDYLTLPRRLGIILEISITLSVIAFFVRTAILAASTAEEQVREANIELSIQNQMVAAQNEEKTVLLQEIHHRVKNNLQVITSLLRLQSTELTGENAKEQFDDAISRIMTMSLIHQKMYQSESLSEINAQDYFQTLLDDLVKSSSVSFHVKPVVDIQIKVIDTTSIVPLALLLSELVSNSLKHAFQMKGQIDLMIKQIDERIHIHYADNGSWKTKESPKGFGLQLIELLTEQLDGSYKRTSDETGTVYLFELNLPKA